MQNLDSIFAAGSVVTFDNPSRAERIAIIERYQTLRKNDHAMSISDEWTSDGHTKPFIRIYHYKTCYRCITEAVDNAARTPKT